MEAIEHIITQHPFFAGMDQELLHLVVSCASNKRFDAGSFVSKEGDEARILVDSGR